MCGKTNNKGNSRGILSLNLPWRCTLHMMQLPFHAAGSREPQSSGRGVRQAKQRPISRAKRRSSSAPRQRPAPATAAALHKAAQQISEQEAAIRFLTLPLPHSVSTFHLLPLPPTASHSLHTASASLPLPHCLYLTLPDSKYPATERAKNSIGRQMPEDTSHVRLAVQTARRRAASARVCRSPLSLRCCDAICPTPARVSLCSLYTWRS